jgi:hypothetical protein
MYQFAQKYPLVNTTKSHTLPVGTPGAIGFRTKNGLPCTTRSAEMSKIPTLLMVGG